MTMILGVIGVCFVAFAFTQFMLWRNDQVYKLHKRMSDRIHELSLKDIDAGRPWNWRWEKYEEVKYETMLNRFWKPLKPEAFYSDLSFLQESN